MIQSSTIDPTQPISKSELDSAPVRNNFGAAANDINNIYATMGQWVSAIQYGADPTGATDTTDKLQAAITAAFTSGFNLYIPTGTYKTSAPLVIGATYTAPSIRSGWKIFGDGQGGNGIGGTVINFIGTSGNAILQVDGGTAYRNVSVEDITLLFAAGANASYGLLLSSTEFSQHSIRRIKVDTTDLNVTAKGFGVLVGTGANGEFTQFEECKAFNVSGFYYTNAGQAFMPNFINCYGFLNTGGVHFNLDLGLSVPGGGFTATNYNGGARQTSGISNSVFLRNNGNTSNVSVIGGRVEHVTQPYLNVEYATGGYAGRTPNTNISGVEFTCDFDATNGSLALVAAIQPANGETLRFQNCQFEKDLAGGANCSFPVNWQNNNSGFWGNLLFDSCSWSQFVRTPDLVSSEIAGDGSVRFLNCRTGMIGTDNTLLAQYERMADFQQLSPGIRSVRDDNIYMQAGAPENQITNPQIANSNGTAVSPLSPWATTGTATIGIEDWNGSPQPRSDSQFARRITIAASSTLYQDITSLDLSSTGTAKYAINGRLVSYITWQLLANLIGSTGGNTTGDFSIVDSVSGRVYEQHSFITNGTAAIYPRAVTLSPIIEKTGTTSYPRIRIRNLGANPLVIDLSSQFVGSTFNAAFAPFTSPLGLGSDYSVAQQLLVAASLNIPHTSDSYGFGASSPIAYGAGRLYVASGDNKLTYNDGTNWHKVEFDPFAGLSGPAYTPTMAVDATQQTTTVIEVSDNVNFTLSSPINPLFQGQQIVIQIFNNTGGAIGTATFGAAYKLGASWSQPGSGKNRSIGFTYLSPNWYETWRSAADVSN